MIMEPRANDRVCNGGSCIVLTSDSDGGPRLRWQLMVDPDGDSGQWLWTIVASDLDGGSWSWWLLTMVYDYNKTAWYIIFLLRYSTITDNNPSIHWPSVMLQSVYSNQCCKYPSLSDVLLLSQSAHHLSLLHSAGQPHLLIRPNSLHLSLLHSTG